jgi:ABC-2 type transport system permease protein
MLGALGLLLASLIRGLENFAGVMNFVIFPLFFLSSALYPLWKMREASDAIATICALNPFTYAVELIRFALYGRFEPAALAIVAAATLVFAAAATYAFDPARGFRARLTGGE